MQCHLCEDWQGSEVKDFFNAYERKMEASLLRLVFINLNHLKTVTLFQPKSNNTSEQLCKSCKSVITNKKMNVTKM